jgi:hypothetical protein
LKQSLRAAGRAAALLASLLFASGADADSVSDSASGNEAQEILRSMTQYLGSLTALSAETETVNEVLATNGEKIHLASSGEVALVRPNKLYMSRQGGFANLEVFFDGQTVTVHGKSIEAYFQFDSAGDIDGALDGLRIETGLEASGGDLFYADAFSGLMTGVTESEYRGIGYVDGKECHHLAFRTPREDWQIWIQTGDEPLPMMYVIINKWVTAAPQYTLRLDDWETTAPSDDRFIFKPGAKDRKLDHLPVDATGEIALEELK